MRGYPSKLVIPSLHNKLTQREAISSSRKNTEKSDDSIFCILDFNPTNPDIGVGQEVTEGQRSRKGIVGIG